MKGTSNTTGKALSGAEHIAQSITDVITTRVGWRVMRRDYGCDTGDLRDKPINSSLLTSIYAKVAAALRRWEPRFKLTRVYAVSAAPGQIVLSISGVVLSDGSTLTVPGVVIS